MILGVSGGSSGAPNQENVIKNSDLFRKHHFLPHFGGPDPPFFQKVQVRVRGSRGGVPGVSRGQNGVKSRVCSVNPLFSGVEPPKIRGPGGVPGGQKGGKIEGLFRKQPFFGVPGGSRGS